MLCARPHLGMLEVPHDFGRFSVLAMMYADDAETAAVSFADAEGQRQANASFSTFTSPVQLMLLKKTAAACGGCKECWPDALGRVLMPLPS